MLRAFIIVFLFIIRFRFSKLKSLSHIIRICYINHVLKLIRKYRKHVFRLRKIHLDIMFLNISLDNDLCPTFLRYKLLYKRLQNSKSYRRSQHLFLKKGTTFKTKERKKFIKELQKIKNDLRTVMTFID